MKRIDVLAVLLLVLWIVLLIPGAYDILGLRQLLSLGEPLQSSQLQLYAIAFELLHYSINIVIAFWLFSRARSIGEPSFLWALLGLVSGPLAFVLFYILRFGERLTGAVGLIFSVSGLAIILIVLQTFLNATNYVEPHLRMALLGQSEEVLDFINQLGLYNFTVHFFQLIVHIGFAIWLVRRSSLYGRRTVLAFFSGLSLGALGAILMETWRLWKDTAELKHITNGIQSEDTRHV